MDKPIYALSIKQPWAWLICKGFKDVENRSWGFNEPRFIPADWYDKVTKKPILPQRIFIHASLKLDCEGMDWLMSDESPMQNFTWAQSPEKFGAIVGEVTITDCKWRGSVKGEFSLWHSVGQYGFVLADPVLYEKPIPYRGQLGFFKPEVPHA